MNDEARKLWTAALRSGEYKQGTGQLRSRGYCCLGVLCDVAFKTGAVKGAWKRRVSENWDGRTYHAVCEDESLDDALLPDAIAAWAGVDGNFAEQLASRNDNGEAFTALADLIDKLP